jgi:hypothetical protein
MMRTMWMLLFTSALALGQAAKPPEPPKALTPQKPLTLAEAIAVAMESNPDVRVAAAEVELARAKLEQTRLQVTAKLTQAYAAKEAADQVLAASEQHLLGVRKMVDRGVSPLKDLSAAEVDFAQAKSVRISAEAAIGALAGPAKPATSSLIINERNYNKVVSWAADEVVVRSRVAEAADALRDLNAVKPLDDFLDESATLKLQQTPIKDFCVWLADLSKGKITVKCLNDQNPPDIHLVVEKMKVAPLLQLVEDDLLRYGYQFYVRDYGLLLCPSKLAPTTAIPLSRYIEARKKQDAKK